MTYTQRGALAAGLAFIAVAPAFAEAADLGPYRPARSSPQAYVPPPPAPPPIADPAFTWAGGYMGFSAGYAWGDTTLTYDAPGHGVASSEPSGALGAFTLGYNVVSPGGLLVGLEGDIGLMALEADDKIVYADGHVLQSSLGDWWGTIRGRVGLASGHTLFYGTGGVAFMDAGEAAIGPAAFETVSNETFKTGWVAGGGIEQMLGPHLTAKVEYLHMDFGTYEGVSASNDAFSFGNTVDLVRAGINYKF